jgi:hypothetical protein
MVLGAAGVLAVVALGSTLFTSAEEDSSVQTVDAPDGWCDVLAAPPEVDPAAVEPSRGFDVVLYLDPSTTPEQLELLRALVEADPEVTEVVRFDQAAAFEEFQDLFESTPGMIDSVQPSHLPPSLRVQLVEGVDPQAVADRYRDEANVRESIVAPDLSSARFVDLLVGPVLLLGPLPEGEIGAGLVGTGVIARDSEQLVAFQDLAPSEVRPATATLAAAVVGTGDEAQPMTSEQGAQLFAAATEVAQAAQRHCGMHVDAEVGDEAGGAAPGITAEVAGVEGPGDLCGLLAEGWPILDTLVGDADYAIEVFDSSAVTPDEVAARLDDDPEVEQVERLDGEAANDAYGLQVLWRGGVPWDSANAGTLTVFRVYVPDPATWQAVTLADLDVYPVAVAPAERSLLDHLVMPWLGVPEPSETPEAMVLAEPIDATAEQLAPVVEAAPEHLRADLQLLVDALLGDQPLQLEPARAAWAAAQRVADDAASGCALTPGAGIGIVGDAP